MNSVSCKGNITKFPTFTFDERITIETTDEMLNMHIAFNLYKHSTVKCPDDTVDNTVSHSEIPFFTNHEYELRNLGLFLVVLDR